MFSKKYYRGIHTQSDSCVGKILNSAKVGEVIQPDLGYTFLTAKKEYALEFAGYIDRTSVPECSFVLEIYLPKGAPISRDIEFCHFLTEQNIVLARGAKFEVLNKEIKDNRTYLKLRYLSCALDEN